MGLESVGLHTCRVRRGGLDGPRSSEGGGWFISVVEMLEREFGGGVHGTVANVLTIVCAEGLQTLDF